jgi:hypothetical protein
MMVPVKDLKRVKIKTASKESNHLNQHKMDHKHLIMPIWYCYSLDLECTPKFHVLKIWLPAYGAIGRW